MNNVSIVFTSLFCVPVLAAPRVRAILWPRQAENKLVATEHVWISSDGDWGALGSWSSNQVPGAGGAVTDTAIFDGTSNVNASVNLNRIDSAPPDDNPLFRIVTLPAFTGNIGASGNSLRHQLSSVTNPRSRIIHRGSGSIFLNHEAGDWVDVIVNSPNGVNAFSGTGTIRHVMVLNGKATLETGWLSIVNTSRIIIDGVGAHLVINGTASTGLDIDLRSGTLECYRNLGHATDIVRVHVRHGVFRMYGKMLDGCRVTVDEGGTLIYKPSVQPISTDNPEIVVHGFADFRGVLDFRPTVFIIGPSGYVVGTAKQTFDDFSASAIQADLREEFP